MLCGIDEAGRGPLAGPVCAAAVVLPNDFPVGILADSKKLKRRQREDARLIIIERAAAWGVGWATHTEIDEINILRASLLAMRRAFEFMVSGIFNINHEPTQTRTFGTHTNRRETIKAKVRDVRVVSGKNIPYVWPVKLETETPFGRPFAPAGVSGAVAIPAGLHAVADGTHTPELAVPCTAVIKADDTIPEVMAASILAKTARDQLMEYYSRLYPRYGYERHKGYPTKDHRKLVLQYGPSPIQRMSFRIRNEE